MLHGRCSHSSDNCKNLRAFISKQKKKEKNFKPYAQGKKELNVLIEINSKISLKNKKRKKTEKILQHYQELEIFDN